MTKIINWIKSSNRYKHLMGGMLIGAGANSLYCAAYAGIGVATALELKDRMWRRMAGTTDGTHDAHPTQITHNMMGKVVAAYVKSHYDV